MKYSIGIDIGGTKIASGIVNQKGDLIQQELVDSDSTDRVKLFALVIKCVKLLMNHSSIPLHEIYSIGAGVPGKIDRKNGVALFQNNLPWDNFPFIARMQEAFHIDRITMDNDVYMAGLAEWKEASMRNNELFVYMTVSTGISSVMIQGGEIIRGAGFQGEVGLIPIYALDEANPLQRLESTAAGPALEKRAIERYKDKTMTSKKVFQAYYNDDPKAAVLIDEIAVSLSQGVYMINSLLDPHKIVFGGSVITHNPVLLHLIAEKLDRYLIDEQKHILKNMELSRLGNEQGIIGAGLSALKL